MPDRVARTSLPPLQGELELRGTTHDGHQIRLKIHQLRTNSPDDFYVEREDNFDLHATSLPPITEHTIHLEAKLLPVDESGELWQVCIPALETHHSGWADPKDWS